MQEREYHRKPKYWPTPQDYNEAVQNPLLSLRDPELQKGTVQTSALGIPKAITGGFASVYKFRSENQDWAVKCFLREVPDLALRYEQISAFLAEAQLEHTARVQFIPDGIKVGHQVFPILKMEWIPGPNLDEYVSQICNQGRPIDPAICQSFLHMCREMRQVGMAHGDLQHGNIIVRNQKLHLVDYDGMYIPNLRATLCAEKGHRNYQHPRRSLSTYGQNLDNFSAWIIYASLKVLSIDSRLLSLVRGGDDCLLFREADFLNPRDSEIFGLLESHESAQLRRLSRFLRWLLVLDPIQVPSLEASPHSPIRLPAVRVKSAQLGRSETAPNATPPWLHHENVVYLNAKAAPAELLVSIAARIAKTIDSLWKDIKCE